MARLGRSDLDVFALCLGGNVFGWTADEHGTPVAAVALAWVRSQPAVVAPIASARNPQQWAGSSRAPRSN